MTIPVPCPACGRTLRAGDHLAGRKVRCPGCSETLRVPEPPPAPAPAGGEEAFDADAFFADVPNSSPAPPADESEEYAFTPDAAADEEAAPSLPGRTSRKKKSVLVATRGSDSDGEPVRKSRRRPPPASDEAPWRDHLYWVFALLLIPLAISILAPDDVAARIAETLQRHPEAAEVEGTKDDLFDVIPGRRLVGAHLPHGSLLHWGYGLAAVVVYLTLLTAMFSTSSYKASRLWWAGFVTGTVGICLLLIFQTAAVWSAGIGIRGRGLALIFVLLIQFIGFSYVCATDPDMPFAMSLMGFTCGVGLCEEFSKTIPMVFYLKSAYTSTRRRGDNAEFGYYANWREILLVGLASGIGFGVSEGIMYSSGQYNGIATGLTYLVRFMSCVALHAVWAGAVALLMYNDQDVLSEDWEWTTIFSFIVRYLLIAMLLHGLYDAFLKHDMPLLALGVAFASFGWLTWLIGRTRAAA